jgi:hypothetical protein
MLAMTSVRVVSFAWQRFASIVRRSLPVASGECYEIPAPTTLHYNTFGIGWRHQTLFSRDFDLILPLFLLDFFREPFLHEAESSVEATCRQSKLTSKRPYRVNLAVSMFLYILNSLLSASKTTLDRHSGHSALPALCIFTKHLTQKRCPQANRIGLNAIEVQMRQA